MDNHEKRLIIQIAIAVSLIIILTMIIFHLVKNKAKEIRDSEIKVEEKEVIKIEPRGIVEISARGAGGLFVRCEGGSIWFYNNNIWIQIKSGDK